VLGNIIGIFITPLWLSLFLSVSGAAPYAAVLTELTYTIIAPLIVGQLLQYLAPRAVSAARRVLCAGARQLCVCVCVRAHDGTLASRVWRAWAAQSHSTPPPPPPHACTRPRSTSVTSAAHITRTHARAHAHNTRAQRARAPQVAWLKRSVNTGDVSSCCILLLVWITFCNTFANAAMRSVPGGDVAATVFLAGALFGLFTALCFAAAWPPRPLARLRLPRRDVVAVVICGATKTVAMGVPLITVMYKDVPHAGLLALPLIVYHALQVLLGGLMLGAFRAWCLAGGSERGGAPAGQAGAASGPAAAAAAAAAAEAEAAGAPAAGAGSEARSSL
jgi:predicted Na+-dependent transporter